MDVIIVEIGARRCAVDLDLVEEVVPLGPITPVPSAPAVVAGAVNVRGEVCPVIHLERAFAFDCPSPVQPRRGQAGLLTNAAGYRAVLYARRLGEVVKHSGAAPTPGSARLETEQGPVQLLDVGAVLVACAEQMGAPAGGDR